MNSPVNVIHEHNLNSKGQIQFIELNLTCAL